MTKGKFLQIIDLVYEDLAPTNLVGSMGPKKVGPQVSPTTGSTSVAAGLSANNQPLKNALLNKDKATKDATNAEIKAVTDYASKLKTQPK